MWSDVVLPRVQMADCVTLHHIILSVDVDEVPSLPEP